MINDKAGEFSLGCDALPKLYDVTVETKEIIVKGS